MPVNPSIAVPNLLTDPGVLFWAPLGSAAPTNTVVGGVFTDTWPVAYVPLGMTDEGSKFTASLTVEPIEAAEVIDALEYRTTGRSAQVEFALKNFTAGNLAKTFNGMTSTVTGTGATTLTELAPPNPGAEVRCMIGWESLDATVRLLCFQVINSGDIALAFAKAPANASLPWQAMCEKPSAGVPFKLWTAGTGRA